MTADSKPETQTLVAECAGNDIQVFVEGDVLFDAMLSDFATAQRRVWLESYIFADDAVGREFMKVLSDCSRRGLDVRVRVDACLLYTSPSPRD